MLYAVISDLHGDVSTLELIKRTTNACSGFLDAGDSQLTSQELSPFISVKGNNDFFSFPKKRLIKIEKELLLIQHYPFLEEEIIEGKKRGIRFFIHGHLHRPIVEKRDNIYIFCPGSPSYPRGDEATYLLLDFSKNDFSFSFKHI